MFMISRTPPRLVQARVDLRYEELHVHRDLHHLELQQ